MSGREIKLATSVPEEFLEVLGAIVVNFAALENALSQCIWFLLGDPSALSQERHQIVTAQLSFKQLVWMASNLYRHRFQDRNKDTIDTFVKQCFQAEEKRNALVHSLWVEALRSEGASDPIALRLKLTAAKKLDLKSEQHTKADLVAVANNLCWLVDTFRSFIIGEVLTQVESGSP